MLIPGPRLPRPRSPGRRHLAHWGRRLAVAAILLVVGVAFGKAALSGYARLFRVDDAAPGDAIVVLLGGLDDRVGNGAALYRKGIAPLVLLGDSGMRGNSGVSETMLSRQILRNQGVPDAAIVTLPGGVVTSTREEAQRVRAYLKDHPMRRITVVTSAFHTRRARWIFRRELAGRGVDIRAAATPYGAIEEANWWRTDEGLVCYLNETLKTIYYWLAY